MNPESYMDENTKPYPKVNSDHNTDTISTTTVSCKYILLWLAKDTFMV